MIRYNNKIGEEFKQLGFDNAKEIFKTAELLFNFTYMFAEVPLNNTRMLGYDRLYFRFILMYPTKKYPNYIHSVTATTGRHGDVNSPQTKISLDSDYTAPPLLTKDEMIRRIEAMAKERQQKELPSFPALVLARIARMRKRNQRGGGNRTGL